MGLQGGISTAGFPVKMPLDAGFELIDCCFAEHVWVLHLEDVQHVPKEFCGEKRLPVLRGGVSLLGVMSAIGIVRDQEFVQLRDDHLRVHGPTLRLS